MSKMNEPARSPHSGNRESRSAQLSKCDPAECTWPCCSRFSISTQNSSQNISHPPSPVSALLSLPRGLRHRAHNPPRVPSPLSLSPAPSSRVAPSPLRFTPLSSPTPTLLTAMPQIYQPRPQQPAASTSNYPQRPTTPHRPPSRSEKLLREALMKDEHERNPLPHQSPVRAHHRSHSHIPTTRTSSDEHHRAEDYTRGNFMFRSAMGPSSATGHQPRSPPSPSPAPASLSRRHSHNQAPGHHHNPQRHELSPYIQSPTASSPRRTHSPSARRTSLSSSQTPALSRRNIPQPLPLSPESYSPTEGIPMTPHEQVLKARLEQVLARSAGGAVDDRRRKRESTEWMPTPTSPISTSGNSLEDEEDDDNYVVDENGGRAWGATRRRNSVRNQHLQGNRKPITPSTTSSGSNSARSGSREEMLSLASGRQRSSTEPTLMPAHRYPSPKRTSTAPSFHLYGANHSPQYRRGGRSGTTPPLVSDGSPTPEEEEEDEEEEDPEDARLITPPPTPPSHAPSYQTHEYMPSPYKTSFDQRRGPPSALGPLKSGRKGFTYEDEDVDADVEEGSEDGYARRPSRHYGTLSASSHRPSHHHQHQPRSASMAYPQPPSAGHPDQHRPQQFNVRRASERCKEMDGFVSFAAIEGLGAPVELDSEEEEEEKRRKDMEERAKRPGGVGDWVRWTKKRLLGESSTQQQQPQCVL